MIAHLIHANTKKEIFVAVPLIFCSYYSDASKCTHVLSSAGAIIPVVESPQTVMGYVSKYLGEKKCQSNETQEALGASSKSPENIEPK